MRLPHLMLGLVAGMTALGTTACAPLKGHQGYVVDTDLVNSVQPGVDTRQSVLAVLGHPSFASQFEQGDWYYLGRDTRNYAYNNPKPIEQTAIRISFDSRGVVSGIERRGMQQVASIHPSGEVTPTLGRDRSFLQELFGNIGTIGASGGGDTAGGGTDTTP